MKKDYEKNVQVLKAIGEINRIKILELLSTGEKCACVILESFNFTQPTLSHHMKVLIDCNIVTLRKEGKWSYYKINKDVADEMLCFFGVSIKEKNKDCTEEK